MQNVIENSSVDTDPRFLEQVGIARALAPAATLEQTLFALMSDVTARVLERVEDGRADLAQNAADMKHAMSRVLETVSIAASESA